MNDHIPDLTKMISDTPRMDLALRKAQEDCTESYLLTEGRKLERELNAANDRIKRLDETLEAITDKIDNAWGIYMEFKEPKP
jgi:predicted nuclease with TOPRIM domain